MLFSWYIKNKQFKKRGSLSGQIAPFLIIILAILLIAAISTVNIGRVSLDKTCSANGADAGALAAASVWAGAFNGLCEWNDSMNKYYDMNYYSYSELYETADSYLTEAEIWVGLSFASATAAAVLMATNAPTLCCPYTIPVGLIIAAALDGAAAAFALQGQMAASAFNITAQYMQSLTDSFHEQQHDYYCAARDYMDESYKNARKAGLSYAFSNSCISSKLTNTQNDAFSAWLAGDGTWGSAASSGTYSWSDMAAQTHPPVTALTPLTLSNHFVTVTLDLPSIATYNLQHTVLGYNAINDLLENLISTSQIIAGVLASVAVTLMVNAIMLAVTFVLCVIANILYDFVFTMAFAMVLCGIADFLYVTLQTEHSAVVLALAALVLLAAGITLFMLRGDNDEAHDGWGTDGIQPSGTCEDAADLMIIKISSLTLTSPRGDVWTALCTVNQRHPQTSSIVPTVYPPLGIESSSTATFWLDESGDVGDFLDLYDSSITGTS